MPRKLWLLRIVPERGYGRLLTGLLLFAALFPLYSLGVRGAPDERTPALFFSLVIAYIIPVFSYITGKAEEALRELRPLLDLDEEAYRETYARLSGTGPLQRALQLGFGALFGAIHLTVYEGSINAAINAPLASLTGLMSTIGTLLTWLIMSTVIFMLVRQAAVFARLGSKRVRATPFNVRRLAPFARVSISASLATIGALALFPLIGLEGGIDLKEILPGAIAIIVPLVFIFLLPVWPLHRRLAALKQQNLADVDQLLGQQLDKRGFIGPDSTDPAQLNLLLTYRRELEKCATWPFDIGNVTRLALYLVIPPLTWVAAALIENLVDAVL